jgi:serine/threonine protein kinase
MTFQDEDFPTDPFENPSLQQVCQIGEGSYGRVSLYFNSTTKTLHLAKFSLDKVETVEKEKAFRREVRVLSTFSHPSAVKLFRYGCPLKPEFPYIEIEFIPGGNLSEYSYSQIKLNRPGLSLSQLLIILLGVTRAVAALHTRKIIHRDLKPENILIDENFEPYLTDFGFCFRIEPESDLTYRGTFNYLAPEVLDMGDFGTPVDIWALGMIIWELRMNKRPFENLKNWVYVKYELDDGNKPKLPEDDIFFQLYEGATEMNPTLRWTADRVADELIRIGENNTSAEEFQRLRDYDQKLSRGERPPLMGKIENLLEAANQKLPMAIAVFGSLLFEGIGIDKDEVRGRKLLCDAYEMGSWVAAYKLNEINRHRH